MCIFFKRLTVQSIKDYTSSDVFTDRFGPGTDQDSSCYTEMWPVKRCEMYNFIHFVCPELIKMYAYQTICWVLLYFIIYYNSAFLQPFCCCLDVWTYGMGVS